MSMVSTPPSPSLAWALYLVTDSTPEILGSRDLCQVVESALRGGVSVVQYRDKHCSHQEAVATAEKLHKITKKYHVPLIINDRVEVAAEVDCEGAHVGQDDMEYVKAREMLGNNKLIGVSASKAEEAIEAAEAGASYVGIGAVFATPTKKDTSFILGTAGASQILTSLSTEHSSLRIPTVCIGGINHKNVHAVLHESRSAQKSFDGIAVVSDIMASSDPCASASNLLHTIVAAKISEVVKRVGELNPLSHNMINLVVQNFAANVALAVGASPIMANAAAEAADIAKLGAVLLINSGTLTPEAMDNYKNALQAYNEANRPVLLDPVGAGATSLRRKALQEIMAAGRFALVKGNEGEILTLNNSTASSQQRGVDSTTTLSVAQKAKLVRDLARRHSTVILMTGKTDVISDGLRTYRVDNGHEMLGNITGSGCTLGTAVSAMIAAVGEKDVLLAALAGTSMFGLAAERAMDRGTVRGPGTFVPAFIDELYLIREESKRGDFAWASGLKVQFVHVEDE